MEKTSHKIRGNTKCPNCEFSLSIESIISALEPLPPSRKKLRPLTSEGRTAISEAARKRWAEFREKKAADVARRVKQIEAVAVVPQKQEGA